MALRYGTAKEIAMYERILVPVDGSDASLAGLNEALALAAQHQGRLRLVHVVDDLVTMPMMEGAIFAGELIDLLRRQGKQLLEESAALCKRKGIAAETVLREQVGGQAGMVIVEQAREWPAELVVMGTHGRKGLKRIVLGSDAEYVVRHTTVPVLLVRAPTEFGIR
jgi:nucleotide-binding universal stress UspA family protein